MTFLKVGFAALAAMTIAGSVLATPASDLLDKLKKTYPNIAFTQVNETVVPGIYETIFGTEVLYVESSGTYFFPTMINMLTKANLGEAKRDELNKINFSELPMSDAIKTVYGTGKHKIAVFADPNCGYCKKLEQNLLSMKDVTVYTFPVAILGPSSQTKTLSITCATGDKTALWRSVMVDGATPVEKTCTNSMADRNLQLFKKFGFRGTPSIIFQNGYALKGYAENERLEELMAKR